jgi:aspartate/methionine/tyrosine aminotransferase
VLTFVLSGLSKIAALPQMKAAWIAAFGPEADLRPAIHRLEVIADTFLSMNAPVQCAMPAWLAARVGLQLHIRARVARNLRELDSILAGQSLVSRLAVEAGWYAVVRVPAVIPGEAMAVRLVRNHGVSVHPGYFFGFSGDCWLVVSLLTPTEEFHAGIRAICRIFSDIERES